MPVITLPNGKHYSSDPEENLLAAALRHEVVLPYSCRNGRCSTCKARAPTGATRALQDELGLTSMERDAGWILTCVRAAVADTALDIEDLTGVDLAPARVLPCRIHSLTLLSPEVMQIKLRLPPTARFTYLPGQYIDISGPAGHRRSYSIANAPPSDKLLELHVKRIAGGELSDYWFERARADDLMRLNGPLGTFFARDLAGLDLVFLATGTGIAPVKAILEGLGALPSHDAPRSVTVYWGGRIPGDLYLNDGAALSGARLVGVLSRADAAWTGQRGYVQQAFLADAPDLEQTIVYACGSDAMIHDARKLLAASGLPERRFFSDAFVCSAAT